MTTAELWTVDPAIIYSWFHPARRCQCHQIVHEPVGAQGRRHGSYAFCARCGHLLQIDDVELPCRD